MSSAAPGNMNENQFVETSHVIAIWLLLQLSAALKTENYILHIYDIWILYSRLNFYVEELWNFLIIF